MGITELSSDRTWLLRVAVIALVVAVIELAFSLFGHPILFLTAGFFAMHVVVLLLSLATFTYVPKDTLMGSRLLINKLGSYLPRRAFQALIANNMLGGLLALGAIAIAEDSDKQYVAVFFSAFWMMFLGSDVILLRYISKSERRMD